MVDFRRQLERAIANQLAAKGTRQVEVPARVFDTRQVEVPVHAFDRAAQETTCASLTVAELADAIAHAVRISERRVLEHVGRLLKLIEAKSGDVRQEKSRITNLHRRLVAIESELHRRKS